ncbi:hypothetical protein IU450_36235 [Nocardia abscessus]|uniref:hypothetical protein n=1 Tax=Nocardia abscessus TaxID=120957 RepID=UPI0018940884|nr:hypothetical protein [Nocardia abscessus]MBF6341292.1 hypothetical protein [Nocardia abscessus]
MDGDITPTAATGLHTVLDADIAAQICREILQDIAEGILPTDLSHFAELHDHVDANLYADGHINAREQLSGQGFSEFIGSVQDVVTSWLQAGRPLTFAVAPPVGPVIVQLHPPVTYPDARSLADLPAPVSHSLQPPQYRALTAEPAGSVEVLQQTSVTHVTVDGATATTYHLVPDEARWRTASSTSQPADRWVYHGPVGYRGVLTKDYDSIHWGTILPPGGGRGSLDNAQLNTNLAESKLAVEGMVAIEAGTHQGRPLVWTRSGPDPGFEAVEVHDYEGPFDFFAVVRVGEDGVVRLSVFGRCEPVCQGEPVESVNSGKADAIAVIQTLIGSATQLETYTATSTRPAPRPSEH